MTDINYDLLNELLDRFRVAPEIDRTWNCVEKNQDKLITLFEYEGQFFLPEFYSLVLPSEVRSQFGSRYKLQTAFEKEDFIALAKHDIFMHKGVVLYDWFVLTNGMIISKRTMSELKKHKHNTVSLPKRSAGPSEIHIHILLARIFLSFEDFKNPTVYRVSGNFEDYRLCNLLVGER